MTDISMQQAMAKSIVKNHFGKLADGLDGRIDNIKFELTTGSSNFDFDKQTIFINSEYMADVNHYVHELFHAISTFKTDNKVIIGFNKKEYTSLQSGDVLETSIGYALNEGATHSLTREATGERFGEINPIYSYNFCANIYKTLENLIGSKLMQVVYLGGGVDNFIKLIEKSCHTQRENVIKLVLNMDAYFDTDRIYSVFMQKENSADSLALLANCYSYLAQIIADHKAYYRQKFNLLETLKPVHLRGKEISVFNELIKNIEPIKTKNHVSLKDYEKMAQFVFENINHKNCGLQYLSDPLRTAEFFNYLLINNYFVDELNLRENFKSQDAKSKLTRLLFLPETGAFIKNCDLPQNIKTFLSTRYVVRADTTVSDYYMIASLSDKNFCDFLKQTDIDYYNGLMETKRF